MVDFRAELAALVAAYDMHRKWTINAVFERLRQAVEHARDVLAQPETASSVEAAIASGQPVTLPSGTVIADPAWFASLIPIRAADPLERQALRPIPVSERLPGPEDCLPWPDEPDETPWCWTFVKGLLDDDSWERRPVTCLATYKSMHTHWLPAHALPLPPLPEVE